MLVSVCAAQVYSPWVLKDGQPDTRDLAKITETLYQNSGATTEREKAEAIWRYLLTDGRFVEPGVFYHIAGWSYEEPMGEVLDPIKLLNSYGFGLCYQVAPMLEALWEEGDLQDARTWFLTGHTVAEVYFDGKYNMLDSDMLGYTTVGEGDPQTCPIASVRQLEDDEQIILEKMISPDQADSSKVPDPWYPADVRAKAMGGYASLFSSQDDNWLFYFKRFPSGHSMDFVLRPGEKLVRFFEPESEGLFYLPFKRIDGTLSEYPREVERWNVRTENGPRSQKDSRSWATGRIEYVPELAKLESYYPLFCRNLRLPAEKGGLLSREDTSLPGTAVFEMPSPYVLINAEFELRASLSGSAHQLAVATSTDGGKTWNPAGTLVGPYSGLWKTGAQVLQIGPHGNASAVSGQYGYLVRLSLTGPETGNVSVEGVRLSSIIQVNPRTLPKLAAGENRLTLAPGPQRKRWSLPVELARLNEFAVSTEGLEYRDEASNGLLLPKAGAEGAVVFQVTSPDSAPLESVYLGGRFLLLEDLAPEKLTAETRDTVLGMSDSAAASMSWALSTEGPWQKLWRFEPPTEWIDQEPEERLLLWPEVDREINSLPKDTSQVYVRYAVSGMALDEIRLAAFTKGKNRGTPLVVTHNWSANGRRISQSHEFSEPGIPAEYTIDTGAFSKIENHSIVFECRSAGE